MKSLNLTDNEKDALCELTTSLKTDWPTVKLVVFGSKAKGLADEESDLDLLILLPCTITENVRRLVIEEVFNINLKYGSNISSLIVTEDEWNKGKISILPIHDFIEEEGIPV